MAALAAVAGYSVWRDQFGPGAQARRSSALPARPAVGFRAPPFSGSDALTGASVELDRLAGRPLLLNFFATWCQPCRDEMPAIEDARRRWEGRAHFVAVDADETEGADKIRSFAQALRVGMPMLPDPGGAIGRDYNVRALPTTFFIDRFGVVRRIVPGAMSPSAIEEGLKVAAQS